MATHVLDICWSPLRTFVLNIPPSRFRHFPVFAGSIWFLTLAALLFTWLGRDCVSFISDIASFELKPLFLVGATITAAGYVVTICGVHVMRYEPRLSLDRHAAFDPAIDDIDYGESPREDEYYRDNLPDIDSDADDEDEDMITTLRLVSLVSIFASTVAGSALVLLAVMDTARYHRAHAFLLQMCFAALVIQSSGTDTHVIGIPNPQDRRQRASGLAYGM
ncbi:hypothetical protein N7512_001691 [Penicillium capsulatum]|nr:hypothetical protein N7512_001691 [Penicillium capsulatum]